MAGPNATRVATIMICCLLLLTTPVSEEAAAQTSALRANSAVLNYNSSSLFQTNGIGSFLTSSWGQLYWIDSGPNGAQLEMDTGRGTSNNVPALSSVPGYLYYLPSMANGPDGAIWLAGGYTIAPAGQDSIFRLDSTGNLTSYPLTNPTCCTNPSGITAGSDGALWFTQTGTGQIGRITTAGVITEFASPCNVVVNGLYNSNLQGPLVSGSDGNLWFECQGTGTATFYRMTTAGQFTAYPFPAGYSRSDAIVASGFAVGPDGNIWFGAETSGVAAPAGVVGSVSPIGAFNFYSLPASTDQILSIVSGPDGALWAAGFGPALGRIMTSGQISLVPVPSTPMTANFLCEPDVINVIGMGPNGSLVFDDGRLPNEENSCYMGSLTPGASSLWPASGTSASPATTPQLAKVNRNPQPRRMDPNDEPPSAPVCGVNIGCNLSAAPQDGLVAVQETISKPNGVAELINVAPQVAVTYTSISNGTYTVGLGIGTDPNHQYGTCTSTTSTGQGGGAPNAYIVTGAKVPPAQNSVMATFVMTLSPFLKGSYDCQIPLHISYSTSTGIVIYFPDNAVTISFHSLNR